MTHKMILMSHDFSKVLKVVVARRKYASIAQAAEHPPRKRKVESSSDSAGPTSDERN